MTFAEAYFQPLAARKSAAGCARWAGERRQAAFRRGSERAHAAVNDELGAHREGRLVPGQIEHRLGDLGGVRGARPESA